MPMQNSKATQTEPMRKDAGIPDVGPLAARVKKKNQGWTRAGGIPDHGEPTYTARQLMKGKFPERVLPEQSLPQQVSPGTASQLVQDDGHILPDPERIAETFPVPRSRAGYDLVYAVTTAGEVWWYRPDARMKKLLNEVQMAEFAAFYPSWATTAAAAAAAAAAVAGNRSSGGDIPWPVPTAPEVNTGSRADSELALIKEVVYEQIGYAPLETGLEPITPVPPTTSSLVDSMKLSDGCEIKGKYLCVDALILMALVSDVNHGTCKHPRKNNPDAMKHFSRWLLPALSWKKIICTQKSAEECFRRLEYYGTWRERLRAFLMFGLTWCRRYRKDWTIFEFQKYSEVEIPDAVQFPIGIVKDGDYPKGMKPGEQAAIIDMVQRLRQHTDAHISHEGSMALALGWACGTTTLTGSPALFFVTINELGLIWMATQLIKPRLMGYEWVEEDGCVYPEVKGDQPVEVKSLSEKWYKVYVLDDENAVEDEGDEEGGEKSETVAESSSTAAGDILNME
ncbi:hypothetical protein B0H67DRAFT_669456 [Lasiosphaeris hirsuta]|uniref:Uncharacterized protein n=1 Tax=Lasiosphaeris hirsuta TaxID=260670 RepID=A0AA40A9N3_9PEZI|nr:hypothetical protein B0H67DRAFT_669456 [Lasiosphaeris hirsuta]